jgi:hypothetical protein
MSAFCSCQVAHRRIKILCFSEVFIVRSRNFRRLRWRMRVIAVRRQAHGRSTEEDFPNECCGKVKFKFVVFEDEQGSTIVQAVSFASIYVWRVGPYERDLHFFRVRLIHLASALCQPLHPIAVANRCLLLLCVSRSTPLQLQIGACFCFVSAAPPHCSCK